MKRKLLRAGKARRDGRTDSCRARPRGDDPGSAEPTARAARTRGGEALGGGTFDSPPHPAAERNGPAGPRPARRAAAFDLGAAPPEMPPGP